MRGRLRHQVQGNPAVWAEGLRKFLTADAVAASNSIEGFRVSTVDVQDLLEGERDVEVSPENREETLAYQRMMTYLQSLHDVEDFSFSKCLLNALHWMLQGHRHTSAAAGRAVAPGAGVRHRRPGPERRRLHRAGRGGGAGVDGRVGGLAEHGRRQSPAGSRGDGASAPGVDPPVGGRQRADGAFPADPADRSRGSAGAGVLLDRGLARPAGQHLGVLPRVGSARAASSGRTRTSPPGSGST